MFQQLYDFAVSLLNSPGLLSTITLIAAVSAFSVYSKQKHDAKSDAANIILIEIENAERQLEKINPENPFPGTDRADIFLMPTASWDKYKYLFGRELDRNEWDTLANFYLKCQSFDEATRLNASYFDRNQQELRINLQRVLAGYAQEYAEALAVLTDEEEKAALTSNYLKKRSAFEDALIGNASPSHLTLYMPMKSENDAKRALRNIESNLSLTSVGTKLKGLAAGRSIRQRAARSLFRTK